MKIPMPLGFPLGFPMAFRPGANPLSCKKSKKSKPGAFDSDKSRGISRLVKLFCQFSWQILEMIMDLQFARAGYFEKMLLKLYRPDFFSEFAPGCAYLRSIALVCARNCGHVFCSKSLSGIETARYF
jgi:hypothetical protein